MDQHFENYLELDEIVQDLEIDDFSRARMDDTEKELREERAAIEELL